MREEAPSRIPWPPILLVAAPIAGWATERLAPVDWPILQSAAARGVGIILAILALATIGWAALELRRARTTIRPDAGATTLVTSGPFRFSRNPIYLADCLGLLGLGLILHVPWIALMVPVFAGLVTWLAIKPEEQHLEINFGQAYRDYKHSTRRWL